MVSYTDCEKTQASLSYKEIQGLIKRFEEQYEEHYKRHNLSLTCADAIRGDDSFAYWLQSRLNHLVHHHCKTEEDERNLRFSLAKRYLNGYLSHLPYADDKTARCALWRWMVCMGRHTEQDRNNLRTVASLAETQVYCRALVQCLHLSWSEDLINSASMSYVELNQRR